MEHPEWKASECTGWSLCQQFIRQEKCRFFGIAATGAEKNLLFTIEKKPVIC